MKTAPLPENEKARLKSLRELSILDTSPESEYDDIVKMASMLAGTPISLISLVDSNRQWFKAKVGVTEAETDRDIAFCAHAILDQEPMIVEDLLEDERFTDNPLVASDPNVRFYAGFPLVTSNGHALGTLCVLDKQPRVLGESQIFGLQTLARQVLRNFELRKALIEQRLHSRTVASQNTELTKAFEVQKRLLKVMGKDIKEPLSGLRSLLQLALRGKLSVEELEEIGPEIMSRLQHTQDIIDHLTYWGSVQSGSLSSKSEIPLRGLVEEQIRKLAFDSQELKIEWNLVEESPSNALADVERTRFVIANVLKRIIAIVQDQEVKVRFSTLMEQVQLSIQFESNQSFRDSKFDTVYGLIEDFISEMEGNIHIVSTGREWNLSISLPRFTEVFSE